MGSQVHAFLPASGAAPSLAADRGASGGLVMGAPDGSQDLRGGLAGKRRDNAEPAADDPLRDEIFACSEVGEVLDIVQDEADTGLPARQVCRLLVRVAALARRRKSGGPRELQALAADPVFDQLLQLVEERVFSFTAKARCTPCSAVRLRQGQSLLTVCSAYAPVVSAEQRADRSLCRVDTFLTWCAGAVQDVAQALHALATLRHRPIRLLNALSTEAAEKAASANAIDVATCVWSLGTLRHLSRAALDALTARMLDLLPTFEPQVRAGVAGRASMAGCVHAGTALAVVRAAHSIEGLALVKFGDSVGRTLTQPSSSAETWCGAGAQHGCLWPGAAGVRAAGRRTGPPVRGRPGAPAGLRQPGHQQPAVCARAPGSLPCGAMLSCGGARRVGHRWLPPAGGFGAAVCCKQACCIAIPRTDPRIRSAHMRELVRRESLIEPLLCRAGGEQLVLGVHKAPLHTTASGCGAGGAPGGPRAAGAHAELQLGCAGVGGRNAGRGAAGQHLCRAAGGRRAGGLQRG